MARRNISPARHAKKFNRTKRRGKAINSPRTILRGGIRL